MIDIIKSMRGLRNHSLNFETAMSALTVAIGNAERLTDLTPDQMERLWAATGRLSKAALSKGKGND